ncbi:fez family zinc finger protein erm-like, partial [Vespula squamosa]
KLHIGEALKILRADKARFSHNASPTHIPIPSLSDNEIKNGHRLTHRNKKPFECKAEGCGKSYCDARSLRRHRENHHAGSKANDSVNPSSPTTGPHTPNTPGSNPSTPSTPGTTSTSNGHGHTALKQLLATEPSNQQQKDRFKDLPRESSVDQFVNQAQLICPRFIPMTMKHMEPNRIGSVQITENTAVNPSSRNTRVFRADVENSRYSLSPLNSDYRRSLTTYLSDFTG